MSGGPVDQVLSNVEIDSMDSAELAQFVLRADMPHLSSDVSERLPLYDDVTLKRLAYQARETWRKRSAASVY